MGDKGDKSAARPPEGSLVETRCLKGPKSAIVPFAEPRSGPKSRKGPGVFSGKNVPLYIYTGWSKSRWTVVGIGLSLISYISFILLIVYIIRMTFKTKTCWWKITSEIHFKESLNKETSAKMFVEARGRDFKIV